MYSDGTSLNAIFMKNSKSNKFKVVRGPNPKDPKVLANDLLTPCFPGDGKRS